MSGIQDSATEEQIAKAAIANGKQSAGVVPGYDRPNGESYWPEPGLTKRELLAAIALGGLCANPNRKPDETRSSEAVWEADALLKELAK